MQQFLNLSYYKRDLDNILPVLHPMRTEKVKYSQGDIYDYTIKLAESEYGKTLFKLFTIPEDYEILLNYATKHGMFLEKYFHRELSIRVKMKILEGKINLKDFFLLYGTQYNSGTYEKVEKYLPQNYALD